MTTTDIFRMLKLAYPFLESFKVEYDEQYICFNLILEMSDDCPDPAISFNDHTTAEEAITTAIQFAMIG